MPSFFGKRIDLPGGRRRAAREPVVLAASIATLDHTYSVLVEDVSGTGARLRGHRFPPEAAEVMVRVGEMEVLAFIMWSTRDQCGIKFDPPLAPAGVQLLQEEGRWAKVLGIVEAAPRETGIFA